MSICLIRAIHNKLLTRDKLLSIGIVDSDTCPLCLFGQESRNHLFFACPYSAYIWSLCRLKLGLDATINSFLEEYSLIRQRFTGKYKSNYASKIGAEMSHLAYLEGDERKSFSTKIQTRDYCVQKSLRRYTGFDEILYLDNKTESFFCNCTKQLGNF